MKTISTYILALILALFMTQAMAAQTVYEGKIEAGRIIHNFGDLVTMTGPVTTEFTFKNLTDKPACLYAITSSCGCTVPKWSKEPFQGGKSVSISVTFKNEDAPGPFDKTLTCYFTNLAKPVILHIKGRVFPKEVSLEERFPHRIGAFGVKKDVLILPNLEQGMTKEETYEIANLSGKTQRLEFTDVHPQISIAADKTELKAGETAQLSVTVRSSRDYWGMVEYTAAIKGAGILRFKGFTKENFSAWSEKEIARAGKPYFNNSTVYLGELTKGTKVKGNFEFRNIGVEPLTIYATDAADSYLTVLKCPTNVPARIENKIEFEVDTQSLEAGEYSAMLTLTTSSPSRPLVNLFVAFIVK